MLVLAYLVCKYKIPALFDGGKIAIGEGKELQKELVSYSVPILLFGVGSLIFYWIDSFSIGFYKSAAEVGFYNAAVPIALLLGIAPELFMQLFFPLITREYAKKRIHLIEQLSKQVAKWILLINLPVLAIILVFPGAVINILFGGQYLIAENALRILAIGSLISSVFVISNHLITMIGKSKLVLINIVIASVVNLVLNFILVPMQKIGFIENASGLNGAAIATLISVCLLNFLFVVQAHKHLSIIPIRRKMLNLFVIALIPTLVLVYLRTKFVSNDLITLGMLGAGYLAVYIVLVFISGALDKNDWLIVRSIWDKVSRTKGS
jgi:O-antigen/teichoic acid export membrane protein